jgi:phosphoenolpyruvate synthase/pyruvate phosphate dikinase
MVNADTPADALAGRKNGAEGIGLCRTEHMVGTMLSVVLVGILYD